MARTKKEEIFRAFSHNSYLLKVSYVDIIQFIERFVKYRLYDGREALGLFEQSQWEILVTVYCIQFKSFLEKQKKLINDSVPQYKEASEIWSLHDLRKNTIECKIIISLRNALEHSAGNFTSLSYHLNKDFEQSDFPSPTINFFEIDKMTAAEKEKVKEYFSGGERLIPLFETSCRTFITTSEKIQEILLGR